MDTLALLCTLHADGPASIHRLRTADLGSIDDVLGCSVETTAEVLGLSMAQGRRFHREARMLAMRTEGEGLDREESMYPGGVAAELAAAQAVMKSVPVTSTRADPVEPAQKTSKPDIASILAPVLERWEKEETSGTDVQRGDAECAETVEATSSAPTSAAPVESLDGVDGELSKALVAAGYGTLEAIDGVDPLALSRAINRPYSEACRVLFLAKRAQASCSGATGGPLPVPAEEEITRAVDDSSESRGVGAEGPGGPFA